jgi:hypothetical protein
VTAPEPGAVAPERSAVTRWRKKPVEVEAHQWFKNGDHPADNCRMITPDRASTTQFAPFLSEGEVVRYFRNPEVPGDSPCRNGCGYRMQDHGWIDTLEGGHIVCPGDWVITGVAGERYPCKDGIFQATYEPAGAGQ